MERLTIRISDKVYFTKGKYPPTTICAEMETWEVRECMTRLAEYEDTELSLEQINNLKGWKTELLGRLCQQELIINRLNEQNKEYKDEIAKFNKWCETYDD